uniref:Integrase core domain-containing protein n=2 Tax=Candidatus Kentrum eta TaxID=2126337 RepID=A0A450VM90_9GAMM|nr:MAG: hypothetical protein BECKH772A_GA0070896_105954 [Candidatus Kentron sp. H]VFK10374.1 MAG: hypothetical protein BECKH772C_GA0070978_107002 [Candidatus Kentron sp. H]
MPFTQIFLHSHVGTLKGVGRIYQQTFVDTYSKVAFAKLYTTKTPITAADLLNDRVLPFFESQPTAEPNIAAKLNNTIINFTWRSMT